VGISHPPWRKNGIGVGLHQLPRQESTLQSAAPTFADLGVTGDLAAALAKAGISTPFPIQAATIPDALAGRDVSGKAPTGSGKTLAFGIPTLVRVSSAASNRPRALVLVPTRELAAQVVKNLRPLATALNRTVVPVYGGVGFDKQRQALSTSCDILVATPGRLNDLIDQGDVQLEDIEIAIIDEADRMADMGFLPQVRRILDKTPTTRQTLLFSATLDGDVNVLVKRYQREPVRHDIIGHESKPDIDHYFWKVDRSLRPELVAEIVLTTWPAVVFSRTKHGADRLAAELHKLGVSAQAIHGDLSQSKRERALASFAAGKTAALIATDVAARGIHVDDVACVVHYDLPETDKDYVHRSGRTGRAGAKGTVISLVTAEQWSEARRLARQVGLDAELTDPDFSVLVETEGPAPVLLPQEMSRASKPHSGRRPGSSGSTGGGRSGRKRRPRRHRAA
jgi:superfamily II DNA/RNA helicase